MSILSSFKQSGDAHVGQTLMRLARLAEAAHQYEFAMRQSEAAMRDHTSDDATDDAISDSEMTEAMR